MRPLPKETLISLAQSVIKLAIDVALVSLVFSNTLTNFLILPSSLKRTHDNWWKHGRLETRWKWIARKILTQIR